MMDLIEAIGYIVMIGIIIGVIGTGIYIAIMAIKSDPDFKDDDDREIYEHEYWKDKNKKT